MSTVPPVWPRPRPDILATGTPALATKGARTKVVVSATPPVECLSTFTPRIPLRSRVSPEPAMIRVRSVISSGSMPWKYTAMAQAAIW